MASSKLAVNIVFALVVAALAITSIAYIYLNSNQPGSQPPAQEESVREPETRPSADASDKLATLKQLIAGEPQNPDYRTQIANLYYDLGQYDKAADFYQQSLNLRPHDPSVETDLASCFHYLGQDDRALELLDRILKYSPSFPQAMFNKGIVLAGGKRDIKGAIAVWEDLLRSNPNFPQRAELEQRINQLKASVR